PEIYTLSLHDALPIFKETGYLLIRAHKAAFGSGKGTPRYQIFLRDLREITNGLIVGQGTWQAQLDANKQAFLQDFVSRSEFTSRSEEHTSELQSPCNL